MTLCVSRQYFMLNLKASTGCEKIGRQKRPVTLCSIVYVMQVSVVPLKFKPELWEYPIYSNVDYMYFFVMCVHQGRKKKSSLEYFHSVPTISLQKGHPVKGLSYRQSLLERDLVSSDQYITLGYFVFFMLDLEFIEINK